MADASTLRHFLETVAAGGYIGGADKDAITAFGAAGAIYAQNATTGSVDRRLNAAAAFREVMLPGWCWRMGHGSQDPGWATVNRLHPDHCDRLDEAHAVADEPARALVLATLKACLAIAEARHG